MNLTPNNSGARIAFFLPSLRGGGAERVMVALADQMASKGYQVDMVIADARGPYLKEVPPTVRLRDLESPRVFFCLPRLRAYLRRERPVGILSTMVHANMVALLAVRLSRVAVRAVVREANIPNRLKLPGASAKSRTILAAMPFFYRWADAVVAVSQGVADDLKAMGAPVAAKTRVIHNPVIDAKLFARAQEAVTHPWLADGGSPVILAAGRLVEQKDYPTLIEAFRQVRRRRVCRLVILGEGPDRPQLQALIDRLELSEDIDLPGFVDNPFPCMARCAAYVLSSRWEGLPNALIQAVALGAPAVATDCHSGPREILEDGRWGELVPVGDTRAMARAIEVSLDRKRNAACPEDFRIRYGADAVTDAYLDLLLKA